MVLRPDLLSTQPGTQRLIGDNTSENITLFAGQLDSFPLGIWMLGGDDSVESSEDSELIYGNDGEDVLSGGENDSLFGGKGKDVLGGGEEGNNYLSGGQDADWVIGGDGNNILVGGKGNDFLVGANGNDTLMGGEGRDILVGGTNNGTVKTGSDLYVFSPTDAVFDINSADFILDFDVTQDRIGLTGGLGSNDVILEPFTNISIGRSLELPKVVEEIFSPEVINLFEDGTFVSTSGTLIKVKNSNALLGVVQNVSPASLQNTLTSVAGF